MAGYICQIERVQKDAIEIFTAVLVALLKSLRSKFERLRGIVSTLFSNHFSNVGAFGVTN